MGAFISRPLLNFMGYGVNCPILDYLHTKAGLPLVEAAPKELVHSILGNVKIASNVPHQDKIDKLFIDWETAKLKLELKQLNIVDEVNFLIEKLPLVLAAFVRNKINRGTNITDLEMLLKIVRKGEKRTKFDWNLWEKDSEQVYQLNNI